MPHIATWDGMGVAPQPVDELTGSFDALNTTTHSDDRGMSPISGNGVFKPQGIDDKGSVIVMDNHFTTGVGGDSITGKDRPMNIWTNGGASTFQDRLDVGPVNKTADQGWWTVDGADFWDTEVEFPLPDLSSENRFVIERFEPVAGMLSFGESLNPAVEVSGTAGPAAKSCMTGQFDMATDNPGGTAAPGGMSF